MNILLIIIICIFTTSAQTDYWPEVLKAPIPEEREDSNVVDIIAKQNLKMDIYKTNNSMYLSRNDSINRIEQKVSYDLSDDNSLGLQNHYLDLSGLFLRKKFPFRFSSLGLEWVPTAAFNRRPDVDDTYRSNGIGSMRLGPVISIDYLNMPIHLGGGAAVDLWQPELPFSPGYQDLKEAKGDPGFYGSIRMGDNREPLIKGIPFFAEGSIFGRYMNRLDNARITNGEVNALFFNDVTFADTFFLYLADTLSKGRTAFLSEQAGGAARYNSTPDRTNNSLQATCGLKNFAGFFLKPSLSYTWALSSVSYPAFEDIVGDERLMSHTISLMANNDNAKFIDYGGGISFTLEDEDWLYKDKLSSEATENNKDSLVKNLQDYESFNLSMFHTIGKTFTNTFGFNYSFVIKGNKKIYPSFYTIGNDTIRYFYDKDNVNYSHILDLVLFSLQRIKLTALTDYYSNEIVYLRKEKSSLNKTERALRLESSLYFNPDSSIQLKETIGGFTKWEIYHFPEFQDFGSPLSMRLYSKFDGIWKINNALSLKGSWSEIYSFDGNYLKGTTDTAEIWTYSLESSVDAISSYKFPNNFIFQIGSLLKYIYYWDWDFHIGDKGDYKEFTIYYMIPFFEMRAYLKNRAFISARIERYMDPDANDYWEAFSNLTIMF